MNEKEKLAQAVKGLPLPLTELLEDAHRLGWKINLGKGGVLTLISDVYPGKRKTIIVPRNQNSVKDRVLKSWHRSLRTYAEPSKLTPLDVESMGGDIREDKLKEEEADLNQYERTQHEESPTEQVRQEMEAQPQPEPEPERGPVAETRPENRRVHLCNECQPGDPDYGRDWGSPNAVSGHKKVHRWAEMEKCDICGYRARDPRGLGQHKRWAHPGWNKQREEWKQARQPDQKAQTEILDAKLQTVGALYDRNDLKAALELIVETAQEALGDENHAQLRQQLEETKQHLEDIKEALAQAKDDLAEARQQRDDLDKKLRHLRAVLGQ